MSKALSALNCYGSWHNIPIFLETETFLEGDRHWFYKRHRNVLKYLPWYQWILHTDLDILVANYSISATSFLDDAFDVILQDRIAKYWLPSGEIHSSAYFVKNSRNGRAFLSYWLGLSDDPNAQGLFSNTDNGILHEAVAHFLSLTSCLNRGRSGGEGHIEFYGEYLKCFREESGNILVAGDVTQSWYHFGDRSFIKVFREFAGFHRDLKQANPCTRINPACHFIPGDFIVHGKEELKYIEPDLLACHFHKSHDGLQGVKHGVWLDLDGARDALSWLNFTSYPGCWENGKNVCLNRVVHHEDQDYPFRRKLASKACTRC
jgi:hypothetical protein